MSDPVHLLPAGEAFPQRGCYPNTPVAVCGEVVTSASDSEEDPRFCSDCVRVAMRWSAL